MRRAIEFLVDMLPLDAAGRRAVDETLADWRHEEGVSPRRMQRLVAALHGSGAIAGTLCRVTAGDATASRTWRMFGASLATTLAIGLAFVVGATLLRDGQFGAPDTVMLLPITIASALPLVLLVPPFAIRRGLPILGLSLMLWVTAAQALSDRLAYVTLAPAALLLGVQTRRFTHHRGWRVGAGAMAIAIAAFAAFPAVLAVDSVREFLRSQFYPAEELRFLRLWVSPLVVLGACSVLAKLTAPAKSERGGRALTAERSY